MHPPGWLIAGAVLAAGCTHPSPRLAGSDPRISWVGRTDTSEAAGPRFAYGGTAFTLRFEGEQVTLHLREAPAPEFEAHQKFPNRYRLTLDDQAPQSVLAPAPADAARDWRWASPRLAKGAHSLTVLKETEAAVGEAQLLGVELNGKALAPLPRPARRLEFIGDSHTAGFGALGQAATCPFSAETESHSDAFAAVAARRLGAEAHFIAFSGRGLTRNYDGDRAPEVVPALWERTLPSRAQPPWEPARFQPDAVVVLLGANDFGRGDPGEGFATAYAAFLLRLRGAYPDAALLALGLEGRGALSRYVEDAVGKRRGAGDVRVAFAQLPARAPDEPRGCVGHATPVTHARWAEVVVAALGR